MAASSEKPTSPIDPTLYHRDDMRAVLAAHDIAGLYQLLKDAGLTQRDIAALTGQSGPSVGDHRLLRRPSTMRRPVRMRAPLALQRGHWRRQDDSGGRLPTPYAPLRSSSVTFCPTSIVKSSFSASTPSRTASAVA